MRHLFVMIVLSAGSIGLAGCRGPQLLPAPRYTIRLERLMPLHPLWAQIESLDSIGKGLDASPALQSAVSWEDRPLPPTFPSPSPVPLDLTKERQRRVEADARRYVQQLEEFLQQRSKDTLARLERAGRKAADARYTDMLEHAVAALKAENTRKADALLADITRLQIRRIGFQSRVNTFKGQSLSDAQLQLKQLDGRIASLNQQRQGLLIDVRPKIAEELEKTRQKMLDDLVENMRKRHVTEEKAIADALENARERLRAEAEAIPSLQEPSLPAPRPAESPQLPLLPGPDGLTPARTTVVAAQVADRAEREKQRERLLAIIRADTQQAAEQIAQQEGWKLTPAGTPGVADYTSHVAEAIRAQWKRPQ